MTPSGARTERRWLLCVGVDDYGAQLRLPDLHCAVADACAVYQVLTREYGFAGQLLAQTRDVERGPFPDLAREAVAPGSRADVLRQLRALRKSMRPEDLFVFFYAGHGSQEPPGYLMPFGAVEERVSSYLMVRQLFAELRDLTCRRQMLFFDCCHPQISSQVAIEASPPPDLGQGRVVAFAAAADDAVSPDRIPRVAEGKFSPFSWNLCRFLRQEVAPGEEFEPETLARYLAVEVPAMVPPEALPNAPDPCYVPEMPAIRPGRGPLRLRRPGLAARLPAELRCRAGAAPLVIAKEADRRIEGEGPLDFTLRSAWPDFAAFHCRDTEEAWELSFDFAGVFPFNLTIADPATGETVVQFFEVTVLPEQVGAPRFTDGRPGVCHRGERYRALLALEGGLPPFTTPRIEGLPAGLGLVDELALSPPRLLFGGRVEESPHAGTAESVDPRRLVHHVRISVRDRASRECTTGRRLVTLSPQDYRHIPTSEFEVGYRPDGERNQRIREMLREHMVRMPRLGLQVPERMRQAFDAFSQDLRDQAVTQALAINPGSRASLPDFYIKKYPVTNFEWREFVRAHGGLHVPRHWGDPPNYFEEVRGKLPVVGVPFEDICRYLAWRGTRLPTAWEWERAARGTQGRLFPWGDDFDAKRCNVLESGHEGLLSVDHHDSVGRSPEGVCDLVGNAAEWVERRVYTPKTPLGAAFAQPFRGGSFLDPCLYALTFRDSAEAGVLFGTDEENGVVGKTAFSWLGFRDVVDLDPEPGAAQGLVTIPAMRVRVGGRESEVPGFRMARYAVSNLEYLEFVQATGYPAPHGWDLRATGSTLPFPSFRRHLPVVHVRYRDALGFCLWKSRQSGLPIRLPTAEQWLSAVEGGEGRIFPWGDEFDLQKCNSLTSGWGQRLPVFALPEGQSAQGVFQLVGNVSEWVGPAEQRGGSWRIDCRRLVEKRVRETVERGVSTFHRNDVGFRYVVDYP